MTIWLHSTVLGTALAATVTIAVAGASYYSNTDMVDVVAKKADRMAMTMVSGCNVADLSARVSCGGTAHYVTVESRPQGENLSILTRMPEN